VERYCGVRRRHQPIQGAIYDRALPVSPVPDDTDALPLLRTLLDESVPSGTAGCTTSAGSVAGSLGSPIYALNASRSPLKMSRSQSPTMPRTR
jgi:hypothetical protein